MVLHGFPSIREFHGLILSAILMELHGYEEASGTINVIDRASTPARWTTATIVCKQFA
jgi:hypothetical protein